VESGRYIAVMLVVMLIFGQIVHDYYPYPDVDRQGYFRDLKSIFLTSFQLLASGWEQILFTFAAEMNTYSPCLLFGAYVFVNVILVGQLIFAIIIMVFEEIDASPSMRIFTVLRRAMKGLSEKERDSLMRDFLLLNTKLWWIHQRIDELDLIASSVNDDGIDIYDDDAYETEQGHDSTPAGNAADRTRATPGAPLEIILPLARLDRICEPLAKRQFCGTEVENKDDQPTGTATRPA